MRITKSVILCLMMLSISPFLADCAVRGMYTADNIGKKAEDISEYNGIQYVITEPDYENSFGYGWEEESPEPPTVIVATPESLNVGPKPYPTEWLEDSGQIKKMTYGLQTGTQFISLDKAGQVRNKTTHGNEELIEEARKTPDFKVDFWSDEPQVLIMHTHTTESFEPYERDFYDQNFNYRTTDPTKNVVIIGEAIANQLEIGGIKTIHDTTTHDYPSYNGAYERSAKTVSAILEQYPSIKIVLDIHRDAVTDGTNLVQPIFEYENRKAAQVMIISGCDDGTMNMPYYFKNFRLAALFQNQMESEFPGLTRPILFDYRKYNQNLTTGSLLVEVGSHGNTLDQVIYSGELIGRAIVHSLA